MGEPRRPDGPGDDAPAYRAAGVDLAGADRFKSRLSNLVGGTHGPEVLTGIGGFGGAFSIADRPEADPVLVATTDGVGTKVLVAQAAGRHDTVGEDLVNHCVDDLLAAGARPLFFLDYMALGRLDEERLRRRLYDFLRRRGFDHGVARVVLERLVAS